MKSNKISNNKTRKKSKNYQKVSTRKITRVSRRQNFRMKGGALGGAPGGTPVAAPAAALAGSALLYYFHRRARKFSESLIPIHPIIQRLLAKEKPQELRETINSLIQDLKPEEKRSHQIFNSDKEGPLHFFTLKETEKADSDSLTINYKESIENTQGLIQNIRGVLVPQKTEGVVPPKSVTLYLPVGEDSAKKLFFRPALYKNIEEVQVNGNSLNSKLNDNLVPLPNNTDYYGHPGCFCVKKDNQGYFFNVSMGNSSHLEFRLLRQKDTDSSSKIIDNKINPIEFQPDFQLNIREEKIKTPFKVLTVTKSSGEAKYNEEYKEEYEGLKESNYEQKPEQIEKMYDKSVDHMEELISRNRHLKENKSEALFDYEEVDKKSFEINYKRSLQDGIGLPGLEIKFKLKDKRYTRNISALQCPKKWLTFRCHNEINSKQFLEDILFFKDNEKFTVDKDAQELKDKIYQNQNIATKIAEILSMIVEVSAIRTYFMSIRMGDWNVAPNDSDGVLEINNLIDEPKPTGFYAFGMSYILGDSPKIKIQDYCYPLDKDSNVLKITLVELGSNNEFTITITITSSQKKILSIQVIIPSENLKIKNLSPETKSIIDVNPETLEKEFTDLEELESFLENILSPNAEIKVNEQTVIPKIVKLDGITIIGDEKKQGGGASSEQQGGSENSKGKWLVLGAALVAAGAIALGIREKRKEYIHGYLKKIDKQRISLIENINTKIREIKDEIKRESSKIYFIIDTKRDNQDDYNKDLVKEYFVAETEILDEQKKCPVLFLIGTSDMCHQIKDTFDDNIPISVLDILGNNDIEIKNYFHDRKKNLTEPLLWLPEVKPKFEDYKIIEKINEQDFIFNDGTIIQDKLQLWQKEEASKMKFLEEKTIIPFKNIDLDEEQKIREKEESFLVSMIDGVDEISEGYLSGFRNALSLGVGRVKSWWSGETSTNPQQKLNEIKTQKDRYKSMADGKIEEEFNNKIIEIKKQQTELSKNQQEILQIACVTKLKFATSKGYIPSVPIQVDANKDYDFKLDSAITSETEFKKNEHEKYQNSKYMSKDESGEREVLCLLDVHGSPYYFWILGVSETSKNEFKCYYVRFNLYLGDDSSKIECQTMQLENHDIKVVSNGCAPTIADFIIQVVGSKHLDISKCKIGDLNPVPFLSGAQDINPIPYLKNAQLVPNVLQNKTTDFIKQHRKLSGYFNQKVSDYLNNSGKYPPPELKDIIAKKFFPLPETEKTLKSVKVLLETEKNFTKDTFSLYHIPKDTNLYYLLTKDDKDKINIRPLKTQSGGANVALRKSLTSPFLLELAIALKNPDYLKNNDIELVNLLDPSMFLDRNLMKQILSSKRSANYIKSLHKYNEAFQKYSKFIDPLKRFFETRFEKNLQDILLQKLLNKTKKNSKSFEDFLQKNFESLEEGQAAFEIYKSENKYPNEETSRLEFIKDILEKKRYLNIEEGEKERREREKSKANVKHSLEKLANIPGSIDYTMTDDELKSSHVKETIDNIIFQEIVKKIINFIRFNKKERAIFQEEGDEKHLRDSLTEKKLGGIIKNHQQLYKDIIIQEITKELYKIYKEKYPIYQQKYKRPDSKPFFEPLKKRFNNKLKEETKNFKFYLQQVDENNRKKFNIEKLLKYVINNFYFQISPGKTIPVPKDIDNMETIPTIDEDEDVKNFLKGILEVSNIDNIITEAGKSEYNYKNDIYTNKETDSDLESDTSDESDL